MPADTRPVLYIIACGAPPASQLPGFIRDAQEQGWDVCVVATPDGMKFLDEGNLAGLTGHPVRNRITAARRGPRDDAQWTTRPREHETAD